MATTDTIILDTMNYLQVLNRTLCKAPVAASYPTVLDTPNLPMAISWPGAGETWQKGHGYNQALMTYRILVFVQLLAQDDIPSRTVDGATLLQQFLNLYVNVANTAQANPPPYQLTIQTGPGGSHITHGGLVPTLSFGGKPFVGFELGVPVRTEWILT